MSCQKPTSYHGPQTVWTGKSDVESASIFHPMSGTLNTAGLETVRVSLQMEQSSGGVKIKPALQTSNDQANWGTPILIGTQSLSANGSSYGAAFTDIKGIAAGSQFIRFGVIAYNNAGGLAVELASVALKLDRG